MTIAHKKNRRLRRENYLKYCLNAVVIKTEKGKRSKRIEELEKINASLFFEAQKIITLLHPKNIEEKINIPHQIIRENYELKNITVDSYNAARDELTHYVQYYFSSWLTTDIVIPPEVAYSRVISILEKENIFPQTIRNCIAGKNGELEKTINIITEALRKQALEQYINYHKTKLNDLYWDKPCQEDN